MRVLNVEDEPSAHRAFNAGVSGVAAALPAAGVRVLHITGPQDVVEAPDGDPADPRPITEAGLRAAFR